MGGRGRVFHCLWDSPRPGHCLRVPRLSYLSRRRRLAGGGPQPAEGMAEVGEADAGLEQGGGGCPDLGTDILGGGAVGPTLQVRDMANDAAHQEGVGWIPLQGGPQSGIEATS